MIKAEIIKRVKLLARGNLIGFFVDRVVAAFFLIVFPVTVYSATGKVLSKEYLENYGEISIYNYIVLGAAIYIFGSSLLSTVSKAYITEVRQGTYLSLNITPYSRIKYFLSVYLYQIIFSLIEFFIIILIGLLFNFDLEILNFNFIFGLLIVSYCYFSTAVIISLIILHIRDSFIVLNTLTYSIMLFSGIIFPYQLLPEILQKVSLILPMTKAIENVRLGVLIDKNIVMILIYSSILLIIGIYGHIKIENKILSSVFS